MDELSEESQTEVFEKSKNNRCRGFKVYIELFIISNLHYFIKTVILHAKNLDGTECSKVLH
jgi:hypothetical protein